MRRGSGLAFIVLLIVALIVAWLAIQQMGSFGFGKKEAETQTTAVQQASEAVKQINDAQQKTMDTIAELGI